MFCFESIVLSMEINKVSKLTVLHHNIGTYDEYLQNLRPHGEDVDEKKLIEERNRLIEIYLKKIVNHRPDIITFLEAYGLIKQNEEGLHALFAQYLDNEYIKIENLKKGLTEAGSKILFYKKERFKEIRNFSTPSTAAVLLEDNTNNQQILVASALLAGFDIRAPDIATAVGNGVEELEKLLDFMENQTFTKTLKIIGMDANAPPYKLTYNKESPSKEFKEFKVVSKRTKTMQKKEGYKTGCVIDGKTMPTPTGSNLFVEDGVRLDYVWVKGPKKLKIKLHENMAIQKDLAPYKLSPCSTKEIPLATEDKMPNVLVPFSDHFPLFYEIESK